jgi:integrase
MASLTIVTREAKDGPRYLVRFRLGGRTYPWVHAGSFKTQKEAKVRRDLVAGEIAAGRNPSVALRALSAAPTGIVSVNTWADRFLASRIDVDSNTKKNYASALRKIGETFGSRDPATITATEVAEWIASLAETRKPGTIGQYSIAFRLLLDHVGLEPNVARDSRVRLPKQVREEPQPPSREHFEAIVEALGPKWKLLFVTIEQGALRLGEAVNLRWADVDAAGLRLRLPRSATKRDRGWVYLPEWLMSAIEDTCPHEDRVPERKVFQGITEASAYQAMTRACKAAKVPHYHPHDLRHRRISMWHQSGGPGTGTRGARPPRAAVDEPRRLLAHDAAGRDRVRAVPVVAHVRGEIN